MNRKVTYVLLGVAILVGLVILGVHLSSPSNPVSRRGQSLLPGLKSTSVKKLEIRNENGLFVFKKEDEGPLPWSLRLPQGKTVEGDADVIGKIIRGFQGMIVEMDYKQERENHGFSPSPQATVLLKGEDFSEEIQLGAKDIGTLRFLRIKGERSVFLVDSPVWGELFLDGLAYRNRRCFSFPPFALKEARIEGAGREPLIVQRALGEGWMLKLQGKSQLELADKIKVDELLGYICGLTVEHIVEEEAIDLTPFGLLPPRIRITLEGEKSVENLLIGREEKGEVFLKREDRPWIGMINKAWLNQLGVKPGDFLERLVLPALSDRILRITVENKEGAWTLQNARADDTDHWSIFEPMELEVERKPVEDFVRALKELRTVHSLKSESNDPSKVQPECTVSLDMDTLEGSRKFYLGPLYQQEEGLRLGWREGEKSAFLISDEDARFLFETRYFRLRKRNLLQIHGDALVSFRVEVEKGSRALRTRRIGRRLLWEGESERGEWKEVELNRVNDFVLPLLELSALEFVGQWEGQGNDDWGLSNPRVFVEFIVKKEGSSQETYGLRFGKETASGTFALLSSVPLVFLLPNRVVEAATNLVE